MLNSIRFVMLQFNTFGRASIENALHASFNTFVILAQPESPYFVFALAFASRYPKALALGFSGHSKESGL